MGNILSTASTESLQQAVLYVGGPFFGYGPIKPLLNYLAGNEYKRAYTHFRRDHHGWPNLCLHLVALGIQLGSNYALLAELDAALLTWLANRRHRKRQCREQSLGKGGQSPQQEQEQDGDLDSGGIAAHGPLALCTSLAWGAHLLLHADGAPLLVRAASVCAIGAAHASRHALRARWRTVCLRNSLIEVVGFQTLFANAARGRPADVFAPAGELLALLAARVGAQLLLRRAQGGQGGNAAGAAAAGGRGGGLGALSRSPAAKRLAALLYGLQLLRMCSDPFGKNDPNPFLGGGPIAWLGGALLPRPTASPFALGAFYAWLPALLTDQPWIYWHGCAFLGSIFQGIAHNTTGEKATLPSLANAADELGHTTFFPTLLLHAVFQSLTSGAASDAPVFG